MEPKPRTFRNVLTDSWPLTTGYRSALTLSVVSLLGAEAAGLTQPLLMRELFRGLRLARDTGLARLVLWMAVLHVVAGALRTAHIFYSHAIGYGMMCRMRERLFVSLQRLSLANYDRLSTGLIMYVTGTDMPAYEVLFAHTLPSLIRCGLILGCVTVVLFALNMKLALWSLAPIPLMLLFMRKIVTKLGPYYRELGQKLTRIHEMVHENVTGVKVIQVFTREPHERRRFDASNSEFFDYSQLTMKVAGAISPGSYLLVSLGTLLVVWQGGLHVVAGTLQIEDLLAYVLYLGFFYGPILEINGLIDAIEQSKASADRAFDIIRKEPAVLEKPGALSPPSLEPAIEFEDVRFSYVKDQPVLKGVSFSIEKGTMVALVGPSGAGKSTITSLVPRFYEVDSGAVRVGGHDVRDLTLASLRSQIAMVLQDTFLFNGTIFDNIAYGRLDATRDEVIEASMLARCHDFVTEFAEGYDTVVGERGARLSGGQRQRVAIARALLRRAPILILDEATSSIDTESERLIQDGLAQLIRGRTTIVIAHRLSTVRRADRILYVQGGQIVESGAHGELLGRDGGYAKLHRAQFAEGRF